MERESFKSRLGFLLVSAGCAVGIGNVWRFPYVVGQNGGGLFVLLYLVMLVVLGLPVLSMELAVGRASRKGAVLACKALEKPKSKWHIHGWFAILGCYLLMMYYTTVSGWMLNYFVKFAAGTFSSGMSADACGKVFSDMLANPMEMGVWMAVTVIAGVLICSVGVRKGLERVSKVMMSALFVLILVLAIHSFTLSGAKEGVSFYLVPNIDNVKSVGLGKVIAAAMNQAFFTLSLGIGAIAIFGSYIDRSRSLTGEAVCVTVLDTCVALLSGFIIFPACFAFGVNPDSGPNLIFITLPNIFNSMAGGRIWGSIFFLCMLFAAASTIIAVFENIISFAMDLTGCSRGKAVAVNLVVIILLSLPCVFGFNLLSGFQPLGAGSTILDLEDFIVSNNLLPLGSLVYLLFCTSRYGWGWKNFRKEANAGTGIKFPKWSRIYVSYILPLIVLFIFVQGYWSKFFG